LKAWEQKEFPELDKEGNEKENGTPKPGVEFEVWQENNAVFDETSKKVWAVTSKRALKALRPIIEDLPEGVLEVTVSVVRIGEGFGTQYSITKLA